MISFHCAHCGQHIEADDACAGVDTSCPTCATPILVPLASDTASPPRPHAVPSKPTPPQPLPPPLQQPPPPPVRHAQPPPLFASAPKSPQSPSSRPAVWPWVIAGVLLAGIGACLIAFGKPRDSWIATGFDIPAVSALAEALGMLIGACLMALLISLVIGGIMAACRLSFSRSLGITFAISVILLMALHGGISFSNFGSGYRSSNVADAQETVQGFEDDIRTLIEQSRDADGMPRRIDVKLESSEPPKNDLERVRQIQQGFLNDLAQLQNEYLAALDEAKLPALLEANRVYEDEDFSESKEIINNLRQVVKRFHKRAQDLLAAYPDRFREAPLSPRFKAGVITGCIEGLKGSKHIFDQIWEMEFSVMDEFNSAINHLEATKGSWSVSDGQILFAKTKDVDRFNEIMATITETAERQEKLRMQTVENALEKFETAKSKLPN